MGILEQILAQVDNVKRVAGKNTKDFIENPADFLNMITGRVKENTEKVVKNPDKAVELALDMSPAGGAAGMIRKGGRTDLNLTHESSIQKLLHMLTGRGSISSPSVAISSNNAFPFRDISNLRNASLILNPASHYFDPRLNPANLLLNRDLYATRQKWTPKEVRLQQGDDLRLTEGAAGHTLEDIYKDTKPDNLPGIQQQLSIFASPRFRSFRDYEKSEFGAGVLSPESRDYQTARDLLRQNYPKEFAEAEASGKPLDAQFLLEKIQADAKKGIDQGLITESALKSVFSDYAELKVAGEVPITDKTVSAVMLSPYTALPKAVSASVEDQLKKITKRAESKGIRVGTPEELMPADMQMTYMDMAEQMARMMMKEREKTGSAYEALDALPASAKNYFPGGYLPLDVEDALRLKSLTAAYENTLDAIKRSSAYAGDTASILTARDLDAVSTPNILKLLQEKAK